MLKPTDPPSSRYTREHPLRINAPGGKGILRVFVEAQGGVASIPGPDSTGARPGEAFWILAIGDKEVRLESANPDDTEAAIRTHALARWRKETR